jgi:CheY-like chemotaxis protein/ribosomal protein L40E
MPMHIVQIEDDSPLRDILKAALIAAQPTVKLLQFISGEDALPYLKEHGQNVDLFIIDIRLPGQLNGLELARTVRFLQCPGYVVLTSAYAAPAREFLEALRAEYIPKPWHLLELTQKVFQYQLMAKPATHTDAVRAVGSEPQLPQVTTATALMETNTNAPVCRACGAPLTDNLGICMKCGTIVNPSIERSTQRVPNAQSTPMRQWSRGGATVARPGIIALRIGSERMVVQGAERFVLGRVHDDASFERTSGERTIDLSQFDAHKLGVSRRHLRVQQKDGAVYITDLGSTNGTYLNDRPVTAHAARLIRNGDVVRLGSLEIQVEF